MLCLYFPLTIFYVRLCTKNADKNETSLGFLSKLNLSKTISLFNISRSRYKPYDTYMYVIAHPEWIEHFER